VIYIYIYIYAVEAAVVWPMGCTPPHGTGRLRNINRNGGTSRAKIMRTAADEEMRHSKVLAPDDI
jgi:hypothetical protein